MAHIIRMIIEIVNATDKIKGIIYPKKVTGLIKITSYYTYHQPLPQGFSLKKWVGPPAPPIF